jgi:hypothetical protein
LIKFVLQSTILVFDDYSSSDLEISVHPSVPKSSTIGLDTGLLVF